MRVHSPPHHLCRPAQQDQAATANSANFYSATISEACVQSFVVKSSAVQYITDIIQCLHIALEMFEVVEVCSRRVRAAGKDTSCKLEPGSHTTTLLLLLLLRPLLHLVLLLLLLLLLLDPPLLLILVLLLSLPLCPFQCWMYVVVYL